MPGYALLLSGLELIHEGEIQYIRIALYAVVLLFIGVALWLVGFDLLGSNRKAYRLGGLRLLLLAAGFSIAVLGFFYWEYNFIASVLE
ncbi:hypothetical protein QMK33_06230 [Hymenobacter sp. H14-R3]|uniref:hypothetical protein n=1 Tax=Hymenobacter sp. H14-R3 TaxID=3046308 RepID=UPI0024BA187B|nr:hypothetical protein [Hymenobacter sp. H14-R3]MDJ0364743.1 hypothetical protein [Hymenobacter sp. H14-R3]